MNIYLFLLGLSCCLSAGRSFKAPWHASIQSPHRRHLCSGAIISDKFIVTTAQCVKHGDVSKFHIVLGSNDLKNKTLGSVYHVEYVLMHPHHDKPKKANDIALLHTTERIKFSKTIKIIECKVDYLLENINVTLSTFGSSKSNPPTDGRLKMRAIQMNIVSHRNCYRAHSQKVRNPIDIGHMCLMCPKDSSCCNQESGNPVVYHNKLVGLFSFGSGCNDGLPHVASRISFFFDFIRTKTLGCSRCIIYPGFTARFFEL